MRRLGRLMLNALTVLSLLLCVATAAIWVRSYFKSDAIVVERRGIERPGDHGDLSEQYDVISAKGGLRLERWQIDDLLRVGEDGDELIPAPAPARAWSLYHGSGSPSTADAVEHSPFTTASPKAWAGFIRGEEDYRGTGTLSMLTYVIVPAWAVATPLLTVTPLLLAPVIRRFRRPARGLCPACGYDLTGNVSGVCPECGTAVVTGSD